MTIEILGESAASESKKSRLTAISTSAKSDTWRTSDPLFAVLHREFDFGIDLAAMRHNRKVRRYLGPDHPNPRYRDALTVGWAAVLAAIEELEGRRVAGFLNPPFSLLEAFVEKAWAERQLGATIVMVNPQKTETAWYHSVIPHADEIRQLRRRQEYMLDDGTSPAPALFSTGVHVFNGRAPLLVGGPRMTWWDLEPELTAKRDAAKRKRHANTNRGRTRRADSGDGLRHNGADRSPELS